MQDPIEKISDLKQAKKLWKNANNMLENNNVASYLHNVYLLYSFMEEKKLSKEDLRSILPDNAISAKGVKILSEIWTYSSNYSLNATTSFEKNGTSMARKYSAFFIDCKLKKDEKPEMDSNFSLGMRKILMGIMQFMPLLVKENTEINGHSAKAFMDSKISAIQHVKNPSNSDTAFDAILEFNGISISEFKLVSDALEEIEKKANDLISQGFKVDGQKIKNGLVDIRKDLHSLSGVLSPLNNKQNEVDIDALSKKISEDIKRILPTAGKHRGIKGIQENLNFLLAAILDVITLGLTAHLISTSSLNVQTKTEEKVMDFRKKFNNFKEKISAQSAAVKPAESSIPIPETRKVTSEWEKKGNEFKNQADKLRNKDSLVEAAKYYQQAGACYSNAVKQNPNNEDIKQECRNAYEDAGDVYGKLNRKNKDPFINYATKARNNFLNALEVSPDDDELLEKIAQYQVEKPYVAPDFLPTDMIVAFKNTEALGQFGGKAKIEDSDNLLELLRALKEEDDGPSFTRFPKRSKGMLAPAFTQEEISRMSIQEIVIYEAIIVSVHDICRDDLQAKFGMGKSQAKDQYINEITRETRKVVENLPDDHAIKQLINSFKPDQPDNIVVSDDEEENDLRPRGLF